MHYYPWEKPRMYEDTERYKREELERNKEIQKNLEKILHPDPIIDLDFYKKPKDNF